MDEQKPVLDYQPPTPKSYRSLRGILLILLCIPFGIACVGATAIGVIGLTQLSNVPQVDRPGDLFGMIMFIIIGLFCGIVTMRWLRAARRIMDRTGYL